MSLLFYVITSYKNGEIKNSPTMRKIFQSSDNFILLTGNILFWALILPRVKHPFCSCGKNGWGGAQSYQRPSGTEHRPATFWNGKDLKGKVSTNTKIQLLVVFGVFFLQPWSMLQFYALELLWVCHRLCTIETP